MTPHVPCTRAPETGGKLIYRGLSGWIDASGDLRLHSDWHQPTGIDQSDDLKRGLGASKVVDRATHHPGPPTVPGYLERVLLLLAAATSAGGNLVTDAQIAALAMSYRAVVHTADRDFLRFPDLICHYPLD